jgi:hypothetical protein
MEISVLGTNANGQKESFEQTSICSKSCGDVRIISSIEDPAVLQKIIAHLADNESFVTTALLPDCRASRSLPVGLFD